jgi:hypothetical protein
MVGPLMTSISTVFLVDVDNTLLNNDRIQADLQRHLRKNLASSAAIVTGPSSNNYLSS